MSSMYAVGGAPSTPLREHVAAEVRAWRGRLNLTQADIGKILGVSQVQASARLRGQMEFSLTEIEKLAEAFGISPAELMGFGAQTHNGPPPGIRGTGVRGAGLPHLDSNQEPAGYRRPHLIGGHDTDRRYHPAAA